MEPERRLDRLRGVVARRGEGRRVRAPDRGRRGQDAAHRAAATTRASRSTRPARSSPSSATRRTTRRRSRRIASITGRRATPPRSEVASAATAGMPKGMVVSEFAPPRFSKDGARLYLGTGAPPAAPRRSERQDAGAGEGRPLELQGSADPADAEGPRSAGARAQLPRRRPPRRQAVRPARDAGSAERQRRRRSDAADRHVRRALPAGNLVGPDLQRRLPARREDRQAEEGARALGQRRDDVAGAASTCCTSTRRPATGSPTASPTARA